MTTEQKTPQSLHDSPTPPREARRRPPEMNERPSAAAGHPADRPDGPGPNQKDGVMVWEVPLLPWEQCLLERLERALGRTLDEADVRCVSWNPAGETLTVVRQPLLGELRELNLMSDVFRAASRRPPDPLSGPSSAAANVPVEAKPT